MEDGPRTRATPMFGGTAMTPQREFAVCATAVVIAIVVASIAIVWLVMRSVTPIRMISPGSRSRRSSLQIGCTWAVSSVTTSWPQRSSAGSSGWPRPVRLAVRRCRGADSRGAGDRSGGLRAGPRGEGRAGAERADSLPRGPAPYSIPVARRRCRLTGAAPRRGAPLSGGALFCYQSKPPRRR